MASLFGGETLFELRSSLQLADIERKGGISPHISPFTQIRDVGALLNHAGFTMLTIDTDEIVVSYPSIIELMYDLKGMGENNAAFNRPLTLSRDVLMAAGAIYQEMYGSVSLNEIPLYDFWFLIFKYHLGQRNSSDISNNLLSWMETM